MALITGAGAGIGEGVARRFAAEGARVVVAELDDAAGATIAQKIGVLFVRTDVSDRLQAETAVSTAISEFGSVDVVVNNAWGGGSIGHVENKADEQLIAGMAVGFYGPFWTIRAAFPHMKANGWGRVINMCSLNGVNAHMGTLEYNAAKEALRALTRTAARVGVHRRDGQRRVPGGQEPGLLSRSGRSPGVGGVGRRGQPDRPDGRPYDDIAPVAVFLASEGTRYLTGNTLVVDGGSHINGVAWAGQLGAIDVLVNNAGIIAVGHAIDEVDTVTRRVLEVNAYGVILGTKLAAQRMLPRARGHIINVVSVGGVLPSAGIATYCATKHAVLGFTDTMRLENRTSGVHFSAVLPSLTNTEMIAGVGKAKGIKNADPEDVAKSIAGLIVKPKPRVVVPRSMGVVVLTQRLLPQRVSEALGRVLGTEHVFTDAVDPEKRKDYAARVGTS